MEKITPVFIPLESKFVKELKEVLNLCLETGQILKSLMEAEVVLIHKKEDIKGLKNYRPISLLSQIHKLFTRVITNRLTLRIEYQQSQEQAGFRPGFSTMDHLHTVNNLIERCHEYNLKLICRSSIMKKLLTQLKCGQY